LTSLSSDELSAIPFEHFQNLFKSNTTRGPETLPLLVLLMKHPDLLLKENLETFKSIGSHFEAYKNEASFSDHYARMLLDPAVGQNGYEHCNLDIANLA